MLGYQHPPHREKITMMSSSRWLASFVALGLSTPAVALAADWPAVAQALGKEGAEQPGGVYRVGLPRSDLKVMLNGVELKPALALGSWVAFKEMGDQAMVMGDLVLTENEVNPVMKRLAEGGVEITALHNHLLSAEPATMFMHVEGHGDPVKLAEALRAGLEQSRTPLGSPSSAGATPPAVELDTAALERVLAHKGKANGGVYQFAIPRAETINDQGMEIPPAMGTAIAINFQAVGEGKAATTGDFVLIADEVNPVLRALRAHGIEVTALHSHM